MATYKLLYCAKIDDDKHAGMLKIGDTDFWATKPLNEYQPNDSVLEDAAKARIRQWSGTAAAGAELVYCEALVRYNSQTKQYEDYRDGKVHTVLQHAGFPKIDFDSALDSGKEWFKVDLPTVCAAVKATKEYRDYLDTSELPQQEIYTLREEQQNAVEETITRYKKKSDMLWHAKMRFGKTITALNLVKDMGFKRTIIITHRPVVEDSWGSDFYHVFSNEDKYAFLTKIQDADIIPEDGIYDEAIDKENDARLRQLVRDDKSIVYFASIQDLRGSKRVGGPYDKNNAVFDTDWDFVIIDEAHEGTKTELGQKVINLLIKDNTKKLDLSGTAYNLFDKYTEKGSVFTWDYVMEQDAKRKWPENHPGEKNPYEDMPVMHINTFDLEKEIREHGIDLSNKTFSFREFFRTWTGELSKDGRRALPDEVGRFVHEDAVKHFLDLLISKGGDSGFPYATKEQCQNAHSLWMVPGVKEAAALSALLKKHKIFGNEKLFGIANVAGEGDHDEEKNYHNALEFVRKTIETHQNSITLSCGRLTTGVTVKEWTSVFMLSGSDTTDAKSYMQTIFRVQSAGKINGVQKKDAYVYDFAPDRTLLVIAESVLGSKKGRQGAVVGDDERYQAFQDFLEFCPVVAIDGAEFKPFGVESLVSQINRVQIDRALRTGFTDNGIYDMSKFKALDEDDIDRMNAIFGKIKETKGKSPLSKAGLAKNGTQKGKTQAQGGTSQPPRNTDDDKKQKELEKNILEKLRTISIRIPLLFFGGSFEIEDGRLAEMITSIDPVSWSVFMPEHFTTSDFVELVKYYNQETVIGAAKVIRSKAVEADKLPPTERVIAITEIFSHFHNPSKETVLTPWRVVNLHMAETLGGWRFLNKDYEENDEEYYRRLPEPEFVDKGSVTQNTVNNPDASILELNSKSGLYPLYVTYSIYRAKLGDKAESDFTLSELQNTWDEAGQQIFVLCQSKMAASITKRTLFGDRDVINYVKYDEKLLKNLKASPADTARKITKGSYWGKEVKKMKFDAVVGNPPYQEETAKKQSKTNGQAPRKNIFQYFQLAADDLSSGVVSLIYPGGRWIHQSGRGMKDFGHDQINDVRLQQVDFYPRSQDIFTGDIAIADGISIVFKNMEKTVPGFTYVYHDGNNTTAVQMNNPGENLIPLNPQNEQILEKVEEFIRKHALGHASDKILQRNLFGIESNFVEENPDKVRLLTPDTEVDYDSEVKLFTNDKAGKAGRSKWYVTDKSTITSGREYISEWQVVVSSANAGGQKRDSQLAIVDNHSAFGRSRVALNSFKTKEEADNFFKYTRSTIIRFLYLMTDEALTSLGMKVPDLLDYSSTNDLVDFSKDLNEQLSSLIDLTENEVVYIKDTVDNMHYADDQ
jgi:hypothetical protein